MSENNGKTVGFGLTTWDEETTNNKPKTKKFDQKDRIPFAKLQKGSNVFRIVTEPYKYYQARYNNKRITASWPKHDDCPVKTSGLPLKKRFYVGVIDRRDNELKLLDIGTLVYDKLKELKDEYGAVTGYDVNIKMNPDAVPANYYSVMQRPAAPLSQADLALVKEKKEALEDSLVRLSNPPDPKWVLKKMEDLGYVKGTDLTPPKKVSKKEKEEVVDTESASSDDDDYSFERPTAQA